MTPRQLTIALSALLIALVAVPVAVHAQTPADAQYGGGGGTGGDDIVGGGDGGAVTDDALAGLSATVEGNGDGKFNQGDTIRFDCDCSFVGGSTSALGQGAAGVILNYSAILVEIADDAPEESTPEDEINKKKKKAKKAGAKAADFRKGSLIIQPLEDTGLPEGQLTISSSYGISNGATPASGSLPRTGGEYLFVIAGLLVLLGSAMALRRVTRPAAKDQ